MSDRGDRTRDELLAELAAARQRIVDLEGDADPDRNRAEQALRVSEARFQAIFEHAPVLIDAFDAEGRCILWNKECEKTFGWTLEEVNARPDPLALFYPDPEIRERVMETVTSLPERVFREWHPMTRAGIPIISMWANFRLPDESVINIGYDITELRQLEDRRRAATERAQAEEERRSLESQLQHAQKLESLGVLAGGIAHDFNNLLLAILGNADLALLELAEDSPARLSIEEVLNASQQAAGLTSQILAYSGRGRFVVEPVDLNVLVGSVLSLLESSISKKVELMLDLSPELKAFEGDSSQIRQVVMNLVINASEAFGDSGGHVRVRTATMRAGGPLADHLTVQLERIPEGEYVLLEVSDSGAGMDPDTRQKIFDPFFTTKVAGRGLGLAAVHGIVRGHKAGVLVDSEPGRGTTFQVLFPALSGYPPPVTDEPSEDTAWQGNGIVLLADDEPMVLSLASKMLHNLGFSVLTASDGDEVVRVFRERHAEIDCLLLDLMMPRMDGEETCEALYKIRADIPVLLSSGYSERESTRRVAGKLAGFIQKPYTLATLRKKLRRILEAGPESSRDSHRPE